MQRTRSIDLHLGVLAHRISVGRMLGMVVTTGIVLAITFSLAVGVAVGAGIAPAFDRSVRLDSQHHLVIHYGARPTCATIPNPPQHDCFRPGSEQREFSVAYLTPHGARSLVWFRLPAR